MWCLLPGKIGFKDGTLKTHLPRSPWKQSTEDYGKAEKLGVVTWLPPLQFDLERVACSKSGPR